MGPFSGDDQVQTKAFLFLCLASVLLQPLTCSAGRANASSDSADSTPSATPPMGWNSWDSYGTTVNEQQVKANAQWMAQHLKAYGWQYITVDMEWFVTDPKPEGNAKDPHYQIDAQGRYQPAENRFPSAKDGAGFKPPADYVHRAWFEVRHSDFAGNSTARPDEQPANRRFLFSGFGCCQYQRHVQMELRLLRFATQRGGPSVLRLNCEDVRGLGR